MWFVTQVATTAFLLASNLAHRHHGRYTTTSSARRLATSSNDVIESNVNSESLNNIHNNSETILAFSSSEDGGGSSRSQSMFDRRDSAVQTEIIDNVPLATATTTSSLQDAVKAFRDSVDALRGPAAICRQVTATLRFAYVTPPITTRSGTTNTLTPTWNNLKIQLLNETTLPDELRPGQERPIAVYIPGLDGYGVSACYYQFDELAKKFELWRLVIDQSDRSSFNEIVTELTDFVIKFAREKNRPVTMIGESCGGLLATAVAIRLQRRQQTYLSTKSNNNNPRDQQHQPQILKGLVLVNPATSFDQTSWDTLVPILTSLKYFALNSNQRDTFNLDMDSSNNDNLTPYGVLGSLVLASLVTDNNQLLQVFTSFFDIRLLQPNKLFELWETGKKAIQGTEDLLPADVLQHRVQKWLVVGAPIVNARISEIKEIPTLLIVGAGDKLIPSQQEPKRWKEKGIDVLETLTVQDRGHVILDDSFNLTEAILYSKIDPYNWKATKKSYDPISDWTLPTDVFDYIDQNIKPFRDAFSPVFFSTDTNGKRWSGLSKIPRPQNPLLFVGNHQLAGLDMQLYLSELLEQRGIFARGLAHPVALLNSRPFDQELRGRTPGLIQQDTRKNTFGPSLFQDFGAVLVSPRNYYRLLQTGQDTLLFPGGAKEALSGDRSYPLYWPDQKTDFVRTAARFNATIVPLSAIGMDDSVNILASPEEMMKWPFIGDSIRESSRNISAARYDQKKEDEVIGFPLAFPAVPQRNYFLFGTPIDTSEINPMDKEACERIYYTCQQEVRRGIDDLMHARQRDPFKDYFKRLAYERVYQRKAPTFPIDELI